MPVEVECDFCGETISRPPSVVERAEHHFCDKACYGKWRSEQEDSRIVLQCDYCGIEFKRYERTLKSDQTNTFCSNECRGRWQVENRPETECTYCGEKITRIQSEDEMSNRSSEDTPFAK